MVDGGKEIEFLCEMGIYVGNILSAIFINFININFKYINPSHISLHPHSLCNHPPHSNLYSGPYTFQEPFIWFFYFMFPYF